MRAISKTRTAIGLAALAAASLVSGASFAGDLDPTGTWLRGDGNAHVRMAPCGSAICATNVYIRDTSKGEAVGDKLVLTLARRSPTELAGKAFDPKRNLTVSMTMTVAPNHLQTRGCVAIGLVCKTVEWTRLR